MSKTIVLIDDDEDDLEILKASLQSIDTSLRCICFSSPIEALSAISNRLIETPHFVFTDINMPMMTGDKVVEALRKRQEYNQTVITVSSTSMPDDVSENLKNLGANFTFQKPNTESRLQWIVKAILMYSQHNAAL